ncbi:MAG: hypothetical protein CMH26_09275 [Micavibrio sp.]|nr:hypothetical protein [Micavibrio sp.]|tara:strand:- start:2491 stop:2823 length:333 start_codon:yes stop_codon:yes gene_type:complete
MSELSQTFINSARNLYLNVYDVFDELGGKGRDAFTQTSLKSFIEAAFFQLEQDEKDDPSLQALYAHSDMGKVLFDKLVKAQEQEKHGEFFEDRQEIFTQLLRNRYSEVSL